MASTKRSRIHDLGRPDITELEVGKKTHRVAEVEPMDVDGVRTMTFGTIAWGIVALALLPFWGNLQDQGRTWWLWTAIAGLGLGLMGIEYCKRRRDALVGQDEAPAATTPEPAAAPKPAKPDKVKAPKADKAPRASKKDAPPAAAAPAAEPTAAPTPTNDPDRPVGRRRRTT